MALQEIKEVWGLLLRKESPAILDLEESLRAKGGMTQDEEARIRVCKVVASAGFAVTSAACGLVGWSALGIGAKFGGAPPMHGLLRFSLSAGGAWLPGKVIYFSILHVGPKFVLQHGEERMKTEMANIILTKHSNEKSLVEAVKKHFFAEHLFSDQYQDRALFRWHLRQSYIDSVFIERVKEIEVNNSDAEPQSISGQKTTSMRSFGDLMEDPLACILGSPESNMESNNAPEPTGNILHRSELRAHRRSHRHRRRHADRFVAV